MKHFENGESDLEEGKMGKDRDKALRNNRVFRLHNQALLSGLAYCISSCSMILVNKLVLSSYDFNAGISLMVYQVISHCWKYVEKLTSIFLLWQLSCFTITSELIGRLTSCCSVYWCRILYQWVLWQYWVLWALYPRNHSLGGWLKCGCLLMLSLLGCSLLVSSGRIFLFLIV